MTSSTIADGSKGTRSFLGRIHHKNLVAVLAKLSHPNCFALCGTWQRQAAKLLEGTANIVSLRAKLPFSPIPCLSSPACYLKPGTPRRPFSIWSSTSVVCLKICKVARHQLCHHVLPRETLTFSVAFQHNKSCDTCILFHLYFYTFTLRCAANLVGDPLGSATSFAAASLPPFTFLSSKTLSKTSCRRTPASCKICN